MKICPLCRVAEGRFSLHLKIKRIEKTVANSLACAKELAKK